MRDYLLKTAAKSLAAGLVVLPGAMAAAYADDGVLTVAEGWGAAALVAAAVGVVWGVPNRPS